MNTFEVLTRGVDNILPSKDELHKLMEARKITLYQGFDPSATSLHLGNLVGLIKLSQFQKLGHKVIFLIGDFTGMIGDPDKKTARVPLTREKVRQNCTNWMKQAAKIIDFTGDNAAELKYNSEWSDNITFKDLIEITSHFSVQQLLERDMFQERLKSGSPLYLHELLYPVAQGNDSLAMGVDLEIGGSDQLFNMMAGRTLVKAVTGRDKYVLTTKLLVDKDGNKAGKTTGNALFLDSNPNEFYGGIMSFSDNILKLAFELLTTIDLNNLDNLIEQDPLFQKKRLAFEVTKLVFGESKAEMAKAFFEKSFQEKDPDFSQTILPTGELSNVLASIATIGSVSCAKRLILDNAVDVNGKTQTDIRYNLAKGDKVKIGKKYFAIVK